MLETRGKQTSWQARYLLDINDDKIDDILPMSFGYASG